MIHFFSQQKGALCVSLMCDTNKDELFEFLTIEILIQIHIPPVLQDQTYSTDLTFDLKIATPTQSDGRPLQEVVHTVRRLCAHPADQQQVRHTFFVRHTH